MFIVQHSNMTNPSAGMVTCHRSTNSNSVKLQVPHLFNRPYGAEPIDRVMAKAGSKESDVGYSGGLLGDY